MRRSTAAPPSSVMNSRRFMEEGCTAHALLVFTCSAQASAEHLEQCAEFPLLRYRSLSPLAVTVLAIPLARRAAATLCAAV
jgi:hypothetical protein